MHDTCMILTIFSPLQTAEQCSKAFSYLETVDHTRLKSSAELVQRVEKMRDLTEQGEHKYSQVTLHRNQL